MPLDPHTEDCLSNNNNIGKNSNNSGFYVVKIDTLEYMQSVSRETVCPCGEQTSQYAAFLKFYNNYSLRRYPCLHSLLSTKLYGVTLKYCFTPVKDS